MVVQSHRPLAPTDWTPVKNCPRCGTTFEPRFIGKSNEQRFCSEKCAKREYSAKRNEKYVNRRFKTQTNWCCLNCGELITRSPGETGRPKRFCSEVCASRLRNRKRKAQFETRACQLCASIYLAQIDEKSFYCSKRCKGFVREKWPRPVKRQAYEPRPDGLTCDECNSPIIAKGKCLKHYSRERTDAGLRKRYDFVCVHCNRPGDSYDRTTMAHARCARISNFHDVEYSSSTELVIYKAPKSKRWSRPAVNILKPGSRLVAGYCRVCGKSFISLNRRQTCSDQCRDVIERRKQREAAKRHKARHGARGRFRQRALRYGVKYEPGIKRLSVYEKSGWRCGICYGEVDPRETDGLWMPSIDHIQPLSRGGGHVRENLQLAHFYCNALKRDL